MTTLLIIDPQNDFHPGGTLAIPTADEDDERTAAFIRDNVNDIDRIVITLDSHQRIHIAHGLFWRNDAGEHPPPLTQIQEKKKCGMKRSIVRNEYTFSGTGVVDRGVFTDRAGETYAGHIKDGFACGLGVTACSGSIIYAEHCPKGKFDGRYLDKSTRGMFTGYVVFERGVRKQQAWLWADGECDYNDEECAPDDPRLLALIEHVGPVQALASAAAKEAKEAVEALPRRLAALELTVTLMLARYREPAVASGLASELLTLPSGLLEIVCEAIVR
jgi:hypothetical protein